MDECHSREKATQQKSPEAKKFEEKAGALAQKVFRREEDREIQCRFEQAFRCYGVTTALGTNREGWLAICEAVTDKTAQCPAYKWGWSYRINTWIVCVRRCIIQMIIN